MAILNKITPESLAKGTSAPADILNTPGLSTFKGTTPPAPSVIPPAPSVIPTTSPVVSAKTMTAPVSAPVKVQQKPIGTSASASSAMMSDVQTQSETMKAEKARADALTPKVSAGEKTMREYYDKLAGKGSAQIMAESEAGIPKLNQELTDITNQIEAKQLSARREIERIQDNKAGLFGGAVQQEVNRIERESARELADLSIIQNARNRNLSTAQDLVNRKIDLEYGDLKDKIEAEKFFYQENKEDLNKAEQNILNERIRTDEREYDKSVSLEKAKQDLIIKASENQNVPISVIQQAQKAGTSAEVASILSPYMRDPLEQEIKQAQLTKLRQEISDATSTGGVIDATKLDPTLTSEQKNNAILTEILRTGKVGQGTKTQIANVLGVIKASEDLAKNRQEGKFTGTSPIRAVLDVKIPWTEIGIPFRQATKRQETLQNEGYLEAINLKVQQWASGASLTKQQIDQVNRFTPRVTDTDANVRTKLNNLSNFMLTQASGQLQSEGINYQPERVNLFETYDLLKEASPEQKKLLKEQGLIK